MSISVHVRPSRPAEFICVGAVDPLVIYRQLLAVIDLPGRDLGIQFKQEVDKCSRISSGLQIK
jgi:hypothetical protein